MNRLASIPKKQEVEKLLKAFSRFQDKIPRKLVELVLAMLFALFVAKAFLKTSYMGVAIVFLLFAAIALLKKPNALIYFAVGLVPVTWINLLGDRLRVISVLTFAAFGYFFLSSLMNRRKMGDRIVTAYLVFLGICALSMLKSIDLGFSIRYLRFFVFSLFFGYTLVLAIREEAHLRTVLLILLGWGGVLSVLALLQSLVSIRFFPAFYISVFQVDVIDYYSVAGIRRAAATFENGPRFAMFLLLPIALTLTSLFSKDGNRRPIYMLAMVLFWLALVVSFTRAALLLAILMLPFLFAFERRTGMIIRSMMVILTASVVLGTLAVLLLPENVLGALGERFTSSGADTYKDRFYFLWNALNAFLENPFLGLGIGTYSLHSWDLMQRFPVPWPSLRWEPSPFAMPDKVPVHNAYGRLLAETGIFGLICLVSIFLFTIRNYLRVIRESSHPFYRRTALAFLLYFQCMIVYWFAHEYIMEEPFLSILPIAVSMILVRLHEKRQAEEEEGGLAGPSISGNRLIGEKGRTP